MKKSTDRDDGVVRQEGRGLVSGNGAGESQALSGSGGIPDPEVEPRAKRRHFSPAYKARIVEEVDSCSERGAVGASNNETIGLPPCVVNNAQTLPLLSTNSISVARILFFTEYSPFESWS